MTIYKTIKDTGIFELKEKGSRFIAFSFYINNETEALAKIQELKRTHFKANHVCFAYKTGFEKFTERANDDGEPAHTAGMPILQQINKYGLTQVLIAVVRYFGGVKLGKGGLIRAYSTSAENSILSTDIIEIQDYIRFNFIIPFNYYNEIIEEIKKNNAMLISTSFEKECNFIIDIPKDKSISFKEFVKMRDGLIE